MFVTVGVRVGVEVEVGVNVGVGVYVEVGVYVGVDVTVGVTVGVLVGVAVGVTVGVGVCVGVTVGVGVGASSIRALKEWMLPHEDTQLDERLRGPSLVTNSFRMRSHPHDGKVHLFRRYLESAVTAYA